MCRAWFVRCNEAAPDDADGKFACEQAEEQNCGKKDTKAATDAGNAGSGSSSASGSATSGSPSATGSDSPSGTETAEASATSAAAGAGASLVTYGTPALVGGLLAIFGLAL
jgi:hypothetical protein